MGESYTSEHRKREKVRKVKPITNPERQSTEFYSLIDSLAKDAGIEKERQGFEIEGKMSLSIKYSPASEHYFQIPEPYVRDKSIGEFESIQSCFAFNDFRSFFMKITYNNRPDIKLKLKGETTFVERNGITLLERKEEQIRGLTLLELNKKIVEISSGSTTPLEYIGTFVKRTSDFYVINPISGRFFQITSSHCTTKSDKPAELRQLEVEYSGRINGFESYSDVYDDLSQLIDCLMRENAKNFKLENTTQTKFEWLSKSMK